MSHEINYLLLVLLVKGATWHQPIISQTSASKPTLPWPSVTSESSSGYGRMTIWWEIWRLVFYNTCLDLFRTTKESLNQNSSVSIFVFDFSIRSVTNHWLSCPTREPVARSSMSPRTMSSSSRQLCTRRQSFCRSFFLVITWWVAILWLMHFKLGSQCPIPISREQGVYILYNT